MRVFVTVLFMLVIAATATVGLLSADERDGIVIERPWARASILKSRPGAVYLTIRNQGPSTDRLIGATSPLAGSVTIHVSEMSNGIMKMRALHKLEIAKGKRAVFKPGGMHLMLMKLREPLRKGERLPLVLKFERAGTLELSVPILSLGANGPDSNGSQSE